MTKDEALQMCLEYIETAAHERKYVRHAIKQALAAPVPCKHEVVYEDYLTASFAFCKHCNKEWTEEMQKSAQPAPEPSFYQHPEGYLMTPTRARFLGLDLTELLALNIAPPAAQRKPLTDEQIKEVINKIALLFGGTLDIDL